MTLSQNEIESLALRAARGAGFSWGLAEEAGLGLGWLAARGMDATAPLLHLLTARLAGETLASPLPRPGKWRAQGAGPLCPITLGAALLDHARLAEGPLAGPLTLDPVAAPVLLVPFLARLADMGGLGIVIEGAFGRARLGPGGAGPEGADIGPQTQALRIAPEPAAVTAPEAGARLPSFDPATIEALGALALRTTVPATEASRSGAGSATPDTD